MPSKVCPICKKEFKYWEYEKRTTCSHTCMGKYRRGENHPNYKDGKRIYINEKRICQYCGKEYEAKFAGSKYCSRLCGGKANKSNLRKGGGIPKWGQIKGGKIQGRKAKTESFRELQSQRMLNGGAAKARRANGQKTTKVEEMLYSIIDKIGWSYEKEEIINHHAVDVYIPEKKLIIEADGNYWHNYPNGTERDRILTKEYKSNGYKMLRFWGTELRNKRGEVEDAIRKMG